MANSAKDPSAQIDELKAENERLIRQLDAMRADRDQYRRGYFELLPPIPFPSEEEMAAELDRIVPADQVIREIRDARQKSQA